MLTLKDTHLFQLFSNNTAIVQKFKKKHMCNNSYMVNSTLIYVENRDKKDIIRFSKLKKNR